MTTEAELTVKVWEQIHQSAARMVMEEPTLAVFGSTIVLSNRRMADGLCQLLARHQLDASISHADLRGLFLSIYRQAPEIVDQAAADLQAVTERDPAATDLLLPFLHFKGFQAIQLYRVAHWLWENGRKDLALYMQNRGCILYSVDIHPAAKIGQGIMLDHATGVVIGETAVVEDNVSMLHGVTLGGTGKERGDRHPKIRQGVMIGAGSKVLGNIEIGEGASIASGSVVLEPVPPHVTVAGVPAKIVGKPKSDKPAIEMDQTLPTTV